jgi:hypothetical protein
MASTALQPSDPTKSRTFVSAPQLGSTLSAIVDSHERVFESPVLVGSDLAEARQAIVQFEAANAPSDPDEVSRMIGKLAILFPNAKLSESEARAQNQLYVELLSDIPQDVLAAAFRKCAQTVKFFPTVAEIRSAAAPEMAMRSWRLMRLKAMVQRAEREPPAPPKQIVTDDQRREILSEIPPEAAAMIERIVGNGQDEAA